MWLRVTAVALALIGAASVITLDAQQPPRGAVPIDSARHRRRRQRAERPEAGVWVIAETTDLPTRFAGSSSRRPGPLRGARPSEGEYKVWVRGYGLVDSPKVDGEPGKPLNLRAVAAPNAAAAAQYYPAIYWYSMLKIPEANQFGGGSNNPGEDHTGRLAHRGEEPCVRGLPPARPALHAHHPEGRSGNSPRRRRRGIRRVQSGQAAPFMLLPLTQALGSAPFKYFADWTDRVAAGELPHSKPARPQGVERNIVVTTWEWGDPKKYLHD
jgi:hypothetical protein